MVMESSLIHMSMEELSELVMFKGRSMRERLLELSSLEKEDMIEGVSKCWNLADVPQFEYLSVCVLPCTWTIELHGSLHE